MLAIERQEQIVSQIRRNGAVRIHELTKQFGVSVETIRRDLLELERQDCLHRVHGGAVGIAVAKQYHRLEERTEENPQKKEELSGYAAGLIREGDVLMVDSGSTAIAFAKMLAEEFERLTVITYSLHVFEILKKKKKDLPFICVQGHTFGMKMHSAGSGHCKCWNSFMQRQHFCFHPLFLCRTA